MSHIEESILPLSLQSCELIIWKKKKSLYQNITRTNNSPSSLLKQALQLKWTPVILL